MAHTHPTASKNSPLHALPPQSIEAEQSIISAILLDNETLFEVLDILRPEDFYRSAHQKIFVAISELFTKNEPCDLVTLTEILKNKGDLDQIGGGTYLASIVDTAPVAVNAVHYARIIHNKASLRRLIEKANAIVKKCFEEQGDVDEVIDFAESSVFEISEHKINPAFFSISQIIDKNFETLEERQANKALVTGVSTGFSRLDTMTAGLQPSDLIILAARPSMGKTSLALNIARNAAIDADTAVAIFSLEMSKEQLSMRMLCSEARIDSNRLRSGFFNRGDWDKLTDAGSLLSDAPIFIDDSANISAIEIRAKARRLKMDKNIGLILIDYLQLMRGRSSAERRDLEISEISRSLKGLAKELNIPIVALSQLNRKLEERGDKRPMLSDLRESGALEQDADVVAFIYRDEVYNKESNNPNRGKAELILAKQRNGPVGTVHMAFLNTYTRFEALAPEEMA